MPLPTSRNRTYALGDPIIPADLNDLQDQIIALANGVTAPLEKVETLSMVASTPVDNHPLKIGRAHV